MPGSLPGDALPPHPAPGQSSSRCPSRLGITCQLAQPPTSWGCYGNRTWRGREAGQRGEGGIYLCPAAAQAGGVCINRRATPEGGGGAGGGPLLSVPQLPKGHPPALGLVCQREPSPSILCSFRAHDHHPSWAPLPGNVARAQRIEWLGGTLCQAHRGRAVPPTRPLMSLALCQTQGLSPPTSGPQERPRWRSRAGPPMGRSQAEGAGAHKRDSSPPCHRHGQRHAEPSPSPTSHLRDFLLRIALPHVCCLHRHTALGRP